MVNKNTRQTARLAASRLLALSFFFHARLVGRVADTQLPRYACGCDTLLSKPERTRVHGSSTGDETHGRGGGTVE